VLAAVKNPRGAGKSLMARAVGLLSRREHSRVELDRKLRRHLGPDDDASEVGRVLDQLQRQDLLSDARFAAALVRQRSIRYGDLRLARDLHDRGVGEAEAGSAMAALAGSEPERALAAWSRRFDALPTNADERGRQGRYLQARGFSIDVIHRVLAGKVDPPD
jgi:regulatory protein